MQRCCPLTRCSNLKGHTCAPATGKHCLSLSQGVAESTEAALNLERERDDLKQSITRHDISWSFAAAAGKHARTSVAWLP